MTQLRYRLVDVFTPSPFRGNPLAVFEDAAGVDDETMQRIAAELNLSETTFLQPTRESGCDFRLRIFTPYLEMPMAGHPTIGTAYVVDHGNRVTFLENVGPIVVERRRGSGGATMWWMSQPPPTWGAQAEPEEVAACLGLTPSDINRELPPTVVSCGVPYLLVALRDLDALARVRVNHDKWASLSRRVATGAIYCFTLATEERGCDVRSRMFAADFGVAEDPGTGSASGPLGCYLVARGAVDSDARLLNVQGVEMGRRNEIHIEIDGSVDSIRAVRVGGECASVGSGVIDVQD